MSAGIARPNSLAEAMTNPSNRSYNSSDLLGYFKQLIPALSDQDPTTNMVITGNMGRKKADWTLADMQQGVTTLLSNNVEELVRRAVQDSWYFYVCPRKPMRSMQVQVLYTQFTPELSQEAAPRTNPREMNIEIGGQTSRMTRMINGFSLDTETLLAGVEKGVTWFDQRVKMMLVGMIETDKFMIMSGIMNMHGGQLVRAADAMQIARGRGGIIGDLRAKAAMMFSLCKERDPLRYWREVSRVDFELLGVNSSEAVTIMHEHARRVILGKDYYAMRDQGDLQYVLDDLRGAVSDVVGSNVFFVRNYLEGGPGKVMNIIGQNTEINLYYPMCDAHAERPDTPYRTEFDNIKIPSSEYDMHIISRLDAIRNSGRYDLVTGKPISLKDAANWARGDADLRARVAGAIAEDAFHVSIAKRHFDSDENSYLGPATHFGSLKPSTVSTDRFLNCAKSVIANMGADNALKIEAAIEEFIALVGEAGNASIADQNDEPSAALKAAITLPGKARVAGMIGCQSSNRVLLYQPVSASTGFVDKAYGLDKATKEMPAGFGSLAGIRALNGALSADSPLKKRVERVVEGAKLFADLIKNKFASSVLLDPNYASSDIQFANHADMLFGSALLPRRSPVIVLGGADATATLRAAEERLREETNLYTGANIGAPAGVSSAASAPPAGPLSSSSSAAAAPSGAGNAALIRRSLALFAMQQFKKTASGAFVVSPVGLFDSVDPDGSNKSPADFIGVIMEAIKTLVKDKGSTAQSALSITGTDIKRGLEELRSGMERASGASNTQPVMTKLYLEPGQIVQLQQLKLKGGEWDKITIGTEKRQDLPATQAELEAYSNSIRSAALSAIEIGSPLTARWRLTSAGSIAAVHSVNQLRLYMAENRFNLPSASLQKELGSSLRPRAVGSRDHDRIGNTLALIKSSGAAAVGSSSLPSASRSSSADPSGVAHEIFACVDHSVDLMVNDNFVEHWDQVNLNASSSLELVIARLYLTSPNDFIRTIMPWATNNVRIPLFFGVGRTLVVTTNPMVRMIPGEQTCILGHGFERTLSGTDQGSGMFGMTASYYCGFIPIKQNNVQIYHDIDAAGYVRGLEPRWANLRTGAPGMVAFLLPAQRAPAVMSPFGAISTAPDVAAGPDEYSSGTESIAMFEQLRHGITRKDVRPASQPLNQINSIPVKSLYTGYPYYRDTTLIAGPSGDFLRHVPPAGPFPKSWCCGELRRILEGAITKPESPLQVGSNYEVASFV